jgi:hypothetical protein
VKRDAESEKGKGEGKFALLLLPPFPSKTFPLSNIISLLSYLSSSLESELWPQAKQKEEQKDEEGKKEEEE